MPAVREKLARDYAETLRRYLTGEGESALQQGYDLARDALRAGLGVMDMAAAHRAAIVDLARGAGSVEQAVTIVERAGELFRECMTPFEMAQRGYQEANATLRSLNAQLEASAGEIAADRETIRSQRDALMRAQRQREQLTAFLVHDLKNPISGIVLNATVLVRDPASSPDQKAAARNVLNSAHAMNRMVLDLLDIGRSEDGALVLRRAEIDLPALLEEIAAAMRTRVGREQQRIVVSTDLARPTLNADRDLIRRVFENLIDNALRYSPRDGTVTVQARDEDGASVEVRVCDQGKGIPEADRERVFEKYVQLESSDSASTRAGRGLGLVFCKLAVEAHGGRIAAESGETQGAVFCVRIPRSG